MKYSYSRKETEQTKICSTLVYGGTEEKKQL